jgi:MoaA/NifB/PqqE/SkfB family radical SAM enzyme
MGKAKILPPLMVSFAVTRECNLRCKHCYSEATDSPHPDELTTAEAKRVIEEIAEVGTRLLIFDGGEPLMRDDIYELIAHAKTTGLQPMLGTNATILSTEVVERIKKAGIRALAISLHGADAKSHNDFCGLEGSWERAMAGIHNVTTAGIPFQVNTCIHRGNLTQLDAIISLAKNLKAMAIEIFHFIPAGRGKKHPDLALTPEEQRHLVSQIIQHQLNDESMVYRCVGIPQFWVEVEKRVSNREAMKRFIRSCCGAALRYCCVFYEGTVYPCMVLQNRAGNIREKSFPEIWQGSEVLRKLRERGKLGKLEGKCGQCAYRQLCGGARCVVFEKTHSLTKEDNSCWFEKEKLKRAIAVQEAGCQYCRKETLVVCQACQTLVCESHSITCPLCHSQFCHPDVRDCFFKHRC